MIKQWRLDPEFARVDTGFAELYRERMRIITSQREEILEAFFAKYGCGPEDAIPIIQNSTALSRCYPHVDTG